MARFSGMLSGDTIALCRGGAWDEAELAPHNHSCRATNDGTYCDIRDYGPSWATLETPKPRINAGDRSAFTVWYNDGSHEGYRFWNLDIRQTSRAYNGPRSFWILDSQSHIDICNVDTQGGYIGVDAGPGADHLTIRNSTFKLHGGMAIGAGAPHLTVHSNTFINNGDQAAVDESRPGWGHSIYTACPDSTSPCPGMRITNNYFRMDPDGAWGTGNPNSRCRGMIVIIRGRQPGIVIENNLIVASGAYGCGAISVSGSFSYTEVHDALIRRNRIFWLANVETTLMQIAACQNCTVADNVIDSAGTGIAIVSPDVVGGTFAPTSGTVIQNNSIRMRGGTAIDVSKEGRDFVVENNAVWMAPGGTCFRVTRLTLRYSKNHCANNGSSPNLIWVDPVNADPARRNYQPKNPGPLIGTASQTTYSPTAIGSATWSPTDRGLARTPPIDIGAYQR